MAPIVTYNHFTAPLWFSAQGGWTNPVSAKLFARYCTLITQEPGDAIHAVITLNEPNILRLLKPMVPAKIWEIQKLTNATAARRLGVERFVCANVAGIDDLPELQKDLLAAQALRFTEQLPVPMLSHASRIEYPHRSKRLALFALPKQVDRIVRRGGRKCLMQPPTLVSANTFGRTITPVNLA